MAVKKQKSFKVNYLIILFTGLFLLVGGILTFLLIIKNIYGNYELNQILPSKENLRFLSYDKENKAAILYSKYSENMLQPAGSTWLKDNIDVWERYLKNSIKMPYDIIEDSTIEKGLHMKYKVLILPGAKSISDKEIVEIKRFIENGGSVFVTGGIATYSDEGKWRGWNFFTEVFGMNFTREIRSEETYKVHTLRGNLPLTGGIPTGYSLRIATWDRPIYAEVLEPRTTQASFWYDFRHEAGLVMEEIKKSAGIAYGTYGKGRFVWFGFEINSVIGPQEDNIYFEKLLQNSMSWLTYSPTAYIKDWPAPYDAAAIVVPTFAEEEWNINNITGILNNQRINATYFVAPERAHRDSVYLASLKKYNSIGEIIDVGYITSANDTINKLKSKDDQYNALKDGNYNLYKTNKIKPNAIMPLFGYYDENTLQAMSNEGIEFLVTDSLTDRSVPRFQMRNGKQMMIVTKTARDDYDIIRKKKLTNPEFQRYTYEEDVDRLIFEGGLMVLKLHTDAQMRPENIGVVNDILQYMRNKKMWITDLDQLRTWWKKKEGVEVRQENRSARRIAVQVNNPADKTSEKFIVHINLNKRVKNVVISSDIINTKIPKFELLNNDQTIYLYIDNMEPKETRSLIIDFDNIGNK